MSTLAQRLADTTNNAKSIARANRIEEFKRLKAEFRARFDEEIMPKLTSRSEEGLDTLDIKFATKLQSQIGTMELMSEGFEVNEFCNLLIDISRKRNPSSPCTCNLINIKW